MRVSDFYDPNSYRVSLTVGCQISQFPLPLSTDTTKMNPHLYHLSEVSHSMVSSPWVAVWRYEADNWVLRTPSTDLSSFYALHYSTDPSCDSTNPICLPSQYYERNNTHSTGTHGEPSSAATFQPIIVHGHDNESLVRQYHQEPTLHHQHLMPPTSHPHLSKGIQPALSPVPRPPGMSANYGGNPACEANWSADIDDHLNTSVVTGLPSDIDTKGLLGCIRKMGRIWATVINYPDSTRCHTSAAAKITFFDVQSAQRFLASYGDESQAGGWLVKGRMARVRPNRIRVAQKETPRENTRVIVISGPAHFLEYGNLERVFVSHGIEFQMEEVVAHRHKVEGWATVELRFGSYRGQAAQVMMLVKRKLRAFGIGARYGRDPCGE
ncbi:Putative protein of unknown function [Podospora comata]|uniref:RRM domain-containing protein n=1 Tax=Podospora comata TaxID=48703 RepID=A0ABY6RZC1_PODCO|nr:Putative protein of unknown function [Podospora comata]